MLRDKEDQRRGMSQQQGKQITVYNHLVYTDTRDCVGVQSLNDTKLNFYKNGGRSETDGSIYNTSLEGSYPTTIYTYDTSGLKENDIVTISNVQGNTNVNGTFKISNVTLLSFDIFVVSIGNYTGSGTWFRNADNGFPKITDFTNLIIGNQMIVKLNKTLKVIRAASLVNVAIPRDFIPIEVYIPDFFKMSTNLVNQVSVSPYTLWTTAIPQETAYMEKEAIGFYSTPLYLFRTYSGYFAMPSQVTPPPLELWNPPIGSWPLQPMPYPYQTVPTYMSNDFENVYIVCSGYGVYDLLDFTNASSRDDTERLRKMLLRAIVQPQSCLGIDYIDLIEKCSTTSNDVYPFGYGNFQRFLPGPGLQQNYQPGTSDSADPTVAGPDWPVPFPNFKGNVYGPYDTPGSRFQKMGLRDTVQDLYLNGDLTNLYGSPIIDPNLTVTTLMTSPNHGILFNRNVVNLENVKSSTNPNILNAMRIVSNGFGAASVRIDETGSYYSETFKMGGGIGPSSLGYPSAWSVTGVNNVSPSLQDPAGVGTRITSSVGLVSGIMPQIAQANNPNTYPAQDALINLRISWYDSGPNNGRFTKESVDYIFNTLKDVTDTKLVISVFQFPRDVRNQSTRTNTSDCIFSVPIRLVPGMTPGNNLQYLEPLQVVYLSQEYSETRFIAPLASLDKMTVSFTTYTGKEIPIEKMLQYRFNDDGLNDPRLMNKTMRNICMTFKFECYQYTTPGLDTMQQVQYMLDRDQHDQTNFNVRASNYQDYA